MRGLLRMSLSALCLCAATAAAQKGAGRGASAGRIDGTVEDSVRGGWLGGALVIATRLGTEPESVFEATTDAKGRFRFDALAAGRYAVTLASPLLDSLELGRSSPEVDVAPGRPSRVALALPSGATIRAIACPGVRLPAHTGALIGRVADADSDRLLGGADVVVAWSELVADSVLRAVRFEERAARATADEQGQYRLCGVPANRMLVAQVQLAGRAGAPVQLAINDAIGVFVRHFSFSAAGARVLAERGPEDTTSPPALEGTATLAGSVHTESGGVVAGAEVLVHGTAATIRTDSSGAYALSRLPAGTQELEVRHIGYQPVRQAVNLRSGRTTIQDVRLVRVVTLDSVKVFGQRTRYREFEEHRKRAMAGFFLTERDIERLRPSQTTDVMYAVPGFRVVGSGSDAIIESTKSKTTLVGRCDPVVVVDGVRRMAEPPKRPGQPIGVRVNDIPPALLAAVEVYPDMFGAPPQFAGACGTIIIHTKR